MSDEQLLADLRSSWERLARAQTHVGNSIHRGMLQVAIDNIGRIGVWHFPNEWSKYRLPVEGAGDEH